MVHDLGDIFLEREFESVDPSGNPGVVKLRIGKPYLYSEADGFTDWRCPVQLIGTRLETVREGRGIDALDALLTSLQLAEVWLKFYARKITWLGQADLGLSLLPPIVLSDEDKARFDVEPDFNQVLEEFFRDYKPKHKDASE